MNCVTDTEITIKRTMSNGALRQSTKTGRVRIYGVTKRAKDILEETRNLRMEGHIAPYVFTRDDGKPHSWESLALAWRKACKQTGIKINLYNGIRHSLGGQLMDEGVELEMVRDILGHTSTNMTRRYAKRSSAVMTRILEFRGKEQPLREAGEG